MNGIIERPMIEIINSGKRVCVRKYSFKNDRYVRIFECNRVWHKKDFTICSTDTNKGKRTVILAVNRENYVFVSPSLREYTEIGDGRIFGYLENGKVEYYPIKRLYIPDVDKELCRGIYLKATNKGLVIIFSLPGSKDWQKGTLVKSYRIVEGSGVAWGKSIVSDESEVSFPESVPFVNQKGVFVEDMSGEKVFYFWHKSSHRNEEHLIEIRESEQTTFNLIKFKD